MESDEDFVVEAPSSKKTKKTSGEDKKKGKKKSVTKEDKASVSPKRKTPKGRKNEGKEEKKKDKDKDKDKEKAKGKGKKKKATEDETEDAETGTVTEEMAFEYDDDEKENFEPNDADEGNEQDEDEDAEEKAKAKKEKKTPKAKKDGEGPKDADQKKIYEYLKKQNRPYSTINIFDNLHGEVKKAACQKALDILTDDGYLQAKEFGKAKVYLFNQQNIPQIDAEDMDKLKKELAKAKQDHDAAKEEVKEMNQNLKMLTNQLTNKQVVNEIAKYKQLVEETRKKLEAFGSENYVQISDDDVKRAEDNKKKYEAEYKKRKRMCMDMINMLSDSMEQKPAALMETIGIDID